MKKRNEDIILLFYKDEETGEELVDHGVGVYTLRDYVLPQEPLTHFRNARWSKDLQAWVV